MTKPPKKITVDPTAELASKVIPITKVKCIATFIPPDWKCPKLYDHLKTASLQRIAWEFLRRNPDYQKAWVEYAGRVRKMAASDADVSRYVDLFLSGNDSSEDWAALGDDEKISELSRRLNDLGHFFQLPTDPDTFMALDIYYGTPWGLETIANPAANYDGLFVRFSESASTIHAPVSNNLNASETVRGMQGLNDTKWAALLVDLSLPLKVIDAQLKHAVRFQREKKTKNGTIKPINNRDISPKKYAEYLRILDASMGGISAKEIGEKIAPSGINHPESRQRDKRYAAALIEAKRIQSGGYRLLPLLEFPRRKKAAKNRVNGQF